MFKKIQIFLFVSAVIVIVTLSYQLTSVKRERDLANEQIGQLKQSNDQLVSDLASQREKFISLVNTSHQEQQQIARLVEQLELANQQAMESQKVSYEAAMQSSCGPQRLPDDLIRLRNARTTSSNH